MGSSFCGNTRFCPEINYTRRLVQTPQDTRFLSNTFMFVIGSTITVDLITSQISDNTN